MSPASLGAEVGAVSESSSSFMVSLAYVDRDSYIHQDVASV